MKKIISAVLVIVLCFSCSMVTFAEDFNNEEEHSIYKNNEIEERLVYNSTWFQLLRTSYSGYEAHFTTNTALESGMGYIYGQETCPNFYIGNSRMSSVGCEIAATYNAIKLRGFVVPCANIIRSFERNGYLMTAGYLGSDPYAIGDYFDTETAYRATEYTDYTTMKNRVESNISSFNVYIVSFWNSDSIFDGLHTVAFYTENGAINIYNYYNNNTSAITKSSFASFVESDKFIVGYFIPRMGRIIENTDN